MKTPGALLLLWVWFLCAAESTPVERKVVFQAETVRIFVSVDAVRVEGTYHFTTASTSPLVAGLFYPIPVDSMHFFPDSIRVISDGHLLPYREVEDGIIFDLRLSKGRVTTAHVHYRQPCLDNSACYILTSTAAWTQPLESADFEIHVETNLELSWVAFEIDEVTKDKNKEIYRFSRRDFMPDKDLCLRWRERSLTK